MTYISQDGLDESYRKKISYFWKYIIYKHEISLQITQIASYYHVIKNFCICKFCNLFNCRNTSILIFTFCFQELFHIYAVWYVILSYDISHIAYKVELYVLKGYKLRYFLSLFSAFHLWVSPSPSQPFSLSYISLSFSSLYLFTTR